jgi:hypothetical protein
MVNGANACPCLRRTHVNGANDAKPKVRNGENDFSARGPYWPFRGTQAVSAGGPIDKLQTDKLTNCKKRQIDNGQMDKWTNGQMDNGQWTMDNGQIDKSTMDNGQIDKSTMDNGQMQKFTT